MHIIHEVLAWIERDLLYIAVHYRFGLGKPGCTLLDFTLSAFSPPEALVARHRPIRPGKEPTMEMSMRLNVLVMVFSFGFIGAIVLGML